MTPDEVREQYGVGKLPKPDWRWTFFGELRGAMWFTAIVFIIWLAMVIGGCWIGFHFVIKFW